MEKTASQTPTPEITPPPWKCSKLPKIFKKYGFMQIGAKIPTDSMYWVQKNALIWLREGIG